MRLIQNPHTRVLLLIAAGLAAAAAVAGIALARPAAATIGTGIVVIDTNLAYQGAQAAGTGMVLTSNGEILTNNHVIKGATTVKVVLPGTGHAYTARVLGYDVADDVAVLQAQGAAHLKTVVVSATTVKLGQTVIARGNAGGTGTITQVRGTVIGLGRSITAGDADGSSEQLTGLIETNAALRPGDSGGPLTDTSGKVVGMNTAASGGFSLGGSSDAFAIPIRTARLIAASIDAGKATARIHVGATAFMGVSVASTAAAGGGYAPSVQGVVVAGVVAGGPAASGGLAQGDVITAIGGQAVTDPSQITALLLTKKPGDTIAVAYVDATGAAQTASVVLGSGPPQ